MPELLELEEPEELELLEALLDVVPELDAEAKRPPEEVELLEAPLGALPEFETIAVLPAPVVEGVSVLAGEAPAEPLIASLTPLSVEPPHPARTIKMANAPRIWAKSPRRRSIIMCTRLAVG